MFLEFLILFHVQNQSHMYYNVLQVERNPTELAELIFAGRRKSSF